MAKRRDNYLNKAFKEKRGDYWIPSVRVCVLRVSGIDKAFGATFVDVAGLTFVSGLAYSKRGSLYVYLKGETSSEEEVQTEIEEVFKEIFGITSEDVSLKEKHPSEYKYTVLNAKNVKNAFAKVSRKFKREQKRRKDKPKSVRDASNL